MNSENVQKQSASEPVLRRFAPISAPTQQPDRVSISEIWRVLRKRALLIGACVALAGLLAIAYCLLSTKKYDAVGRIAVNFENSNVLGLENFDMLGGGAMDSQIRMETQVRVLMSDSLAWEVIKELRLDQKTAFAGKFNALNPAFDIERASPEQKSALLRRFRENLRVQVVPKTLIVEIRYRSTDPALAATVVNTLANTFIETSYQSRFQTTVQASDWLSSQLDDLKTKVEKAQQRLADYQKENNLFGNDENNTVLSEVEDLNRRLVAATSDRIVREAQFRLASSGNPEFAITGDASGVPMSATLEALKSRRAELQAQYAQLTEKFGPNYPKVIELQSQQRQVEESIRREQKDTVERIRAAYIASRDTERMLQAKLDSQKQVGFKLNQAAVQYAIMKQEVESGRELYNGLLKKVKEAGVTAGLKSTNISIVDLAAVPVSPSSPNVPMYLAVALMAGAWSGLGLAFLVENLDHSVASPEDIESVCGLPSIGVIPRDTIDLPRTGAQSDPAVLNDWVLTTLSRPKSQVAEAYRSLRTSLLLSAPTQGGKVIVVTSSVPQEGKSTVAINTAAVLAQRGAKVLLVDADLRRPTVHNRLSMRINEGLSGLLAGVADEKSVVQQFPLLPTLSVIAAGKIPPYPAELLGSARMNSLLSQWREEYEHIVIDTPPVLAVTDPVILAHWADAVLLVARSGKTSGRSLKRSCDVLANATGKIVGVVMNDFNLKSSAYYDYYGYSQSEYGQYYTDERADAAHSS